MGEGWRGRRGGGRNRGQVGTYLGTCLNITYRHVDSGKMQVHVTRMQAYEHPYYGCTLEIHIAYLGTPMGTSTVSTFRHCTLVSRLP